MFELKSNPDDRRPLCDYVTTTSERIRVRVANPAQLFKWIDRIYLTLGAVALGCTWVPFVIPSHRDPISSLLFLIAGGIGLIFRGCLFKRSSTRAILSDTRRPALYLRSFADDQSRFKSLFQKGHDLGEVELVSALEAGGPVLAIGRPGEPMPPEGALRIYVDDAHWKAVVIDLALRSRVVVLRGGESDGLQWELKQVSQIIDPTRLILFVPVKASSKTDSYWLFRTWAQECLTCSLPGQLTGTTLLYFHSDWSPALVQRGQTEFVDVGVTRSDTDQIGANFQAEDSHPGTTQATSGLLDDTSVPEFLIVRCPSCGIDVHPKRDATCPSCQMRLPDISASEARNTVVVPPRVASSPPVVHPIHDELIRLARDESFFQDDSLGWLAGLRNLFSSRKRKSSNASALSKALDRATFRIRASVSNAFAIVVIIGLLLLTILRGPQMSGPIGRVLKILNDVDKYQELEKRQAEENRKRQSDSFKQFTERMKSYKPLTVRSLDPKMREVQIQSDIAKHPNEPLLRLEMARHLMTQGKYSAAEKHLLVVNDSNSSAIIQEDALLFLSRVYEKTDRIDLAKISLQTLLKSDRHAHREAAKSALDRLAKSAKDPVHKVPVDPVSVVP